MDLWIGKDLSGEIWLFSSEPEYNTEYGFYELNDNSDNDKVYARVTNPKLAIDILAVAALAPIIKHEKLEPRQLKKLVNVQNSNIRTQNGMLDYGECIDVTPKTAKLQINEENQDLADKINKLDPIIKQKLLELLR